MDISSELLKIANILKISAINDWQYTNDGNEFTIEVKLPEMKGDANKFKDAIDVAFVLLRNKFVKAVENGKKIPEVKSVVVTKASTVNKGWIIVHLKVELNNNVDKNLIDWDELIEKIVY